MARIALSQAVDEYLSWLELDRHAAEGTVAEYRRDLEAFTAFAGGDAAVPSVARLDRDVLRAYQRHLARVRTGPKGSKRPLAVSTRPRRLVALRSFLRFCAREEWLPGDLGATIDVPRLPERLPKPLDSDDRDRLLEVLPAAVYTNSGRTRGTGCCGPRWPALSKRRVNKMASYAPSGTSPGRNGPAGSAADVPI